MNAVLFWMGLLVGVVQAQEAGGLFPFLISYDGPTNATSMAHLLDAPAGKHGFVRVVNGRFATAQGPIRFNGSNLTGAGNFPSHAEADALAGRLARLGINCIRMHHLDTYWKWKGLIADDPTTQRTFNPEMLERMDYLVYALKQRGIYVNLNLHVGRWWDARDGFGPQQGRTYFDKGLDNFEPRMIELQKEYARKLLTHVNPYTQRAYCDEPCVAMVEINNENALFNEYNGGGIDGLREPFATVFRTQWSAWLRAKYGTTEAVLKAWKWPNKPVCDEQIPEGSFDSPIVLNTKVWIVQKGQATVDVAVARSVLALTVSGEGGERFPKLFRVVKIKKDEPYTLSFKIRRSAGEGNTELGLALADMRTGWKSAGVQTTFHVGSTWKTVRVPLLATETLEAAQIQLTRFPAGAYEIDDFSFQSGAESQLSPSLTVEAGTIPALKRTGFAPRAARADFVQFMVDTETAYWTGMYRFLKDELKVKSVISGTQMGYSPTSVQAQLDYIDNHSYWCHPSGKSLLHDRYAWQIENRSMVNSMATMHGLCGQRVEGKPYTVSEYNHPYPNQYGAEGHPFLCAYGRLQGWDGVFQYTYNHDPDFEPTRTPRYFDLLARTDVLAHFPACAAIFIRGDVQEAKQRVTASVPYARWFEEAVSQRKVAAQTDMGNVPGSKGLVHSISVDLSGTEPALASAEEQNKVVVSDTEEIVWNRERAGKGLWTINTPNVKFVTGYPEQRAIALGAIQIAIGKTRLNWATLSLVSRWGNGFGGKGKASILLAATGLSENKGTTMTPLGRDLVTIRDQWGEGVQCEGIPATITIHGGRSVRCYALDGAGVRQQVVPVEVETQAVTVRIGPQFKTVWYELEID